MKSHPIGIGATIATVGLASLAGCFQVPQDATESIVDFAAEHTLPTQATLSDLIDVTGDQWSVACPYSTRSELEEAFNHMYKFGFLPESDELNDSEETLIVVDSTTGAVTHYSIDRSQASFCVPSWDNSPITMDAPLTIEDRPDDDGIAIQRSYAT